MYALTLKSENRKTGPIPTSVSSAETCPSACALKDKSCYAKTGPLHLHWEKVTSGERGDPFDFFLAQVEALPDGQLWRHNVAGDLAGRGNRIDAGKLAALTKANRGKRGFTYTHKPPTPANLAAIRAANEGGFTVNLSADSVAIADALAVHDLPMVVVLPSDATENFDTPGGKFVVICPATQREDVSCSTCGICQRAGRSVVVGFPAHGQYKRRIDIALKGGAS